MRDELAGATAAVASFGLPALAFPGPVAAAVGLLLYAVVLTTTLRPLGLQKAWAYVRTLH